MHAICTGSRVYGTPRDCLPREWSCEEFKKSDTDLVIYVEDEKTYKILKEQADNTVSKASDHDNGASLRFGNLNLIVCFRDSNRYSEFNLGSRILEEIGPVTRDFAVKFFEALRESFRQRGGIKDGPDAADLYVTWLEYAKKKWREEKNAC